MTELRWHKAARSNAQAGGNCVEVADGTDRVLVRDSKDAAGPMLTVRPDAWRSFLAVLPELDR